MKKIYLTTEIPENAPEESAAKVREYLSQIQEQIFDFTILPEKEEADICILAVQGTYVDVIEHLLDEYLLINKPLILIHIDNNNKIVGHEKIVNDLPTDNRKIISIPNIEKFSSALEQLIPTDKNTASPKKMNSSRKPFYWLINITLVFLLGGGGGFVIIKYIETEKNKAIIVGKEKVIELKQENLKKQEMRIEKREKKLRENELKVTKPIEIIRLFVYIIKYKNGKLKNDCLKDFYMIIIDLEEKKIISTCKGTTKDDIRIFINGLELDGIEVSIPHAVRDS